MGRCTVIGWACAAGVLCCWGCSAPKIFSPSGWMQGSSSAQTAAAKDPSNPLKPADSSASGSSTASGDGATGSSGSADKVAAEGGFKSAPMDPALRKLMEDELQTEPAEKRQQMMADWSKFDSAFIRQLVEEHRMAREVAESHQGGKGGGWDGAGAVKTASHDQSPQTPVFDDPSAPKDSVLHERPSAPASARPNASTAPASSGAVSPWEDPPSASPPSPRTVATSTASLSQSPVAPSATAAPAQPSAKSDLWDFDNAPKTHTSDSLSAETGRIRRPDTDQYRSGYHCDAPPNSRHFHTASCLNWPFCLEPV
jgi:hypothetical protein